MSTLYETDSYARTQEQAERLRAAAKKRPNDPIGLDRAHLAEKTWGLALSLGNELCSIEACDDPALWPGPAAGH